MPYPNETPMSPEDREEQDRRRWEHYDRMTYGDPDAFDKHRDDELLKQYREENDRG